MAQNMKDIKRRIGSVGSIMQITNAMELVSSAKLRKARTRLEKTRPYYETVYENINEILSLTKGVNSPLLDRREIKTRAILVLASDRGLAGGYNINVVKEAEKIINNNDNVENIIYTTGTRAVDALRKTGCRLNEDFTSVGEEPSSEDASRIGDHLANLYKDKKIDEVLVVYTKFNSVMNLEPQVLQLLPATGFDQVEGGASTLLEFEPSPSVVLTQMVRQYTNVTIYGCLLEASASEQASRRTAMENATSNGEELLDELELLYNRARQASITQEISEIVGGAEALK